MTGTDLKSTGTDLKSTETDSKWSYMDWNEQKQTRKIPERARNEVAYFIFLYISVKARLHGQSVTQVSDGRH